MLPSDSGRFHPLDRDRHGNVRYDTSDGFSCRPVYRSGRSSKPAGFRVRSPSGAEVIAEDLAAAHEWMIDQRHAAAYFDERPGIRRPPPAAATAASSPVTGLPRRAAASTAKASVRRKAARIGVVAAVTAMLTLAAMLFQTAAPLDPVQPPPSSGAPAAADPDVVLPAGMVRVWDGQLVLDGFSVTNLRVECPVDAAVGDVVVTVTNQGPATAGAAFAAAVGERPPSSSADVAFQPGDSRDVRFPAAVGCGSIRDLPRPTVSLAYRKGA